ncbi:hypothetical protein [Klebsiella pneumoniae]|uniref:hypothetical protein n=1 Tax=Klebsiella pneumoniae TaxID=573 RepID=UPI00114149DC|nr:hypothetical protein FCG89_013730 [Klebsiella pneumoniae]
MNIETVNELIASLESAGELSIREQKFLKLAKEFRICSASLDTAIKTGNVLADQNAQLAAENVGLKKFIKTECFVGQDKPDICLGLVSTRYVRADGFDPETPATDRIVAGIKADGVEWIEGNEPSEFGRYWVRYETDVGPQYCSAKWMEYNFCASSDTNIHKIWLADHSRSINSLKGVTHYAKLPTVLEDQQLREGADK